MRKSESFFFCTQKLQLRAQKQQTALLWLFPKNDYDSMKQN